MTTYNLAYDFIQPDFVIFLGDLMDEAHIASKEDFYQYVRRIFGIFLGQQKPTKHVRVRKINIVTFHESNDFILAHLVAR